LDVAKLWQWLTADRFGLLLFLALAAFLEAFGDSNLNRCLQGKEGLRFGVLGSCVLVGYGIILNLPDLKFSQLMGIYVVFFFLAAQYLAFQHSGQRPTPPVLVGGSLIVAGGLVIHLWRA
jgi:small multidrug resistance family-3 protein